jgi:hypothetical protein
MQGLVKSKGRFRCCLSGFRVTYIDQVMKEKKKMPGPSSYKPNYPKSGSKM